jgi:hypothetical protein
MTEYETRLTVLDQNVLRVESKVDQLLKSPVSTSCKALRMYMERLQVNLIDCPEFRSKFHSHILKWMATR